MKKRILSVLSLCLVFGMLCAAMLAFAGCGDDDKNENGGNGGSGAVGNDGTYYLYDDGEIDESVYVRISGSKWSGQFNGVSPSGKLEISGNKLAMLYTFGTDEAADRQLKQVISAEDGETVTVYSGTIENGVIMLDEELGKKQSNPVYLYRDGVVPGENKLPDGLGTAGNPGNTGTPGNGGNSSGAVNSIDGVYTAEDNSEVLTLRSGNWTVVGASYEFNGEYELNGNEITLYMEANGVNTTLLVGTVSGNVITFNGLRYVK